MTRPPASPRSIQPQAYRGERLGLPPSGSGSLADAGPRVGAFIVDCLASALVAAGVVASLHRHGDAASRLPGSWSLIPFFLDYVIGLLVAGRTLGMYLFGLRVIRVDRDAPVTPIHAIERTLLLVLLVPPLIFDRDGRGLHDRLTRTAVVRN